MVISMLQNLAIDFILAVMLLRQKNFKRSKHSFAFDNSY